MIKKLSIFFLLSPFLMEISTGLGTGRNFCLSKQPQRPLGKSTSYSETKHKHPSSCSKIIICKWTWPSVEGESKLKYKRHLDSLSANNHNQKFSPGLKVEEVSCPPCTHCPSGSLHWDAETESCKDPTQFKSPCQHSGGELIPGTTMADYETLDPEDEDDLFRSDGNECSPNYFFRRYVKDQPESIELTCPEGLIWDNNVHTCTLCHKVPTKSGGYCCKNQSKRRSDASNI